MRRDAVRQGWDAMIWTVFFHGRLRSNLSTTTSSCSRTSTARRRRSRWLATCPSTSAVTWRRQRWRSMPSVSKLSTSQSPSWTVQITNRRSATYVSRFHLASVAEVTRSSAIAGEPRDALDVSRYLVNCCTSVYERLHLKMLAVYVNKYYNR